MGSSPQYGTKLWYDGIGIHVGVTFERIGADQTDMLTNEVKGLNDDLNVLA